MIVCRSDLSRGKYGVPVSGLSGASVPGILAWCPPSLGIVSISITIHSGSLPHSPALPTNGWPPWSSIPRHRRALIGRDGWCRRPGLWGNVWPGLTMQSPAALGCGAWPRLGWVSWPGQCFTSEELSVSSSAVTCVETLGPIIPIILRHYTWRPLPQKPPVIIQCKIHSETSDKTVKTPCSCSSPIRWLWQLLICNSYPNRISAWCLVKLDTQKRCQKKFNGFCIQKLFQSVNDNSVKTRTKAIIHQAKKATEKPILSNFFLPSYKTPIYENNARPKQCVRLRLRQSVMGNTLKPWHWPALELLGPIHRLHQSALCQHNQCNWIAHNTK